MKPIDKADFGKTASDYKTHRAGFPPSLLDRLLNHGIGGAGQRVLDLGTGTGTLARLFAQSGSDVTGIDPAASMIDAAWELDAEIGVEIAYRVTTAENTGLPDASFDVVAAGQCWHWFDRPAATHEIRRLLAPRGRVLIAHYDWLPLKGNVVERTEKLIERYNPDWRGGGLAGIHPLWFQDLGNAGFDDLESFTYDEPAIYSHEAWRGRIRASAGIAASLDPASVEKFDGELADILQREFPEDPLSVPHRVFALFSN